MIRLNGNYGEGGGQIIRTALGLSAFLRKPFEIDNIRKGRCDSGLKNQHLFCVKTIKELCNAEVTGDSLCSEHLRFVPGELRLKNMEIDIQTAGSITLLMQSLLIPSVFADKKAKFKIKGGTDVKWSQPYDYFAEVLVPQLRRFADIDVRLIKRGYYPKGNGDIEVSIKPKNKDQSINLVDQFTLIQIKGVSHASSDLKKAQVAERQAKTAELSLKKLCPVHIRTEYSQTKSTGSGITLWAVFAKDEIDIDAPIRLGADCLGERGKKAEKVGEEAAKSLIREINSNAPVDKHLADQLLPFMALTNKSKINVSEITNHCKTNIYVIEKFLGKKFLIDGNIIST